MDASCVPVSAGDELGELNPTNDNMKKLMMMAVAAAMIAPVMAREAKAEAKPSAVEDKAQKPAPAAPKAMPLFARVSEIDAAGNTFTTVKKDGTKVKFVVTASTEIKQGEKSAKFVDIKVGDDVSGLRLKRSDTEYEVVKITKFAPHQEKAAKEKKTT